MLPLGNNMLDIDHSRARCPEWGMLPTGSDGLWFKFNLLSFGSVLWNHMLFGGEYLLERQLYHQYLSLRVYGVWRDVLPAREPLLKWHLLGPLRDL
jgi:hypothetical protein